MAADKREGWLRDLKPGDKVALDGCGLGGNEHEVYTVKRVTPAGRIICTLDSATTDAEHEFTANGMPQHKDAWRPRRLVQYTPELVEKIRRRKLVSGVCRHLDMGVCSREKVEALGDEHLGRLYNFLRALRP